MKKIILIFTIVFVVSFIQAQRFYGGVVFGVSGSQIDGDTQGGYSKPGLTLGVFTGTKLSEKTAFDIELYYIGKGALMNVKYPDGTVFQQFKSHLNYVEMPLFFVWNATEKISVAGGIASAFNISSKLYYMGGLLPESTYTINDFDISPVIKAGFKFNKKLSVNVRVQRSVFSIMQNDYLYNKNLVIALGYTFGQ